jgi:hypothetical protein
MKGTQEEMNVKMSSLAARIAVNQEWRRTTESTIQYKMEAT